LKLFEEDKIRGTRKRNMSREVKQKEEKALDAGTSLRAGRRKSGDMGVPNKPTT